MADWRPEDPARTVLSMCSSLLAVVQPEGCSSPIVQFAHFSAQEYLMSPRLAEAKDTISHFHVSMTPAHTVVAQACLGLLLHLDETITKDSLENFPLAEYAAEFWVGHAQIEDVSSKLQDGTNRLFDPSKSHFSVWVWIYDLEYNGHSLDRPERSEHPGKARASPLHYAAFCGMHDVSKFLVVEHSQDVNARGFADEETPLHVALRRGHADIAQLLLEHGADAKARDDGKRTPLFLASERGLLEVVLVLLERGSDPNAPDRNGCCPLERASEGGHAEVAQVLLEHGANVKAQDRLKFTALNLAHGEDISRLLLKHGADANVKNIRGRTPLHDLSEAGGVGAARVLLEHGVDVNARDAGNVTPLHLASRGGYLEGVRLLLQNGADIHARDEDGQTPFMAATDKGHNGIMQLLLGYGAEDHREK